MKTQHRSRKLRTFQSAMRTYVRRKFRNALESMIDVTLFRQTGKSRLTDANMQYTLSRIPRGHIDVKRTIAGGYKFP